MRHRERERGEDREIKKERETEREREREGGGVRKIKKERKTEREGGGK